MVVKPSLRRTSSAVSILLSGCALALPIQAKAALQIPDDRFAEAQVDALFQVRFGNSAGLVPTTSDVTVQYYSSGHHPAFPVTHLDGNTNTDVSEPDNFGDIYVVAGFYSYGYAYAPGPDDEFAGAYQELIHNPLELATLTNDGTQGVLVDLKVWASIKAGFVFEGPGLGWSAVGYQLRADAPDGELFDHRFDWDAYQYRIENGFDVAYHADGIRNEFNFDRSVWLDPGESIKVYMPEFSSIIAIELWPRAVPEPALWTMLIAGFGLVGVAVRRRRAATA